MAGRSAITVVLITRQDLVRADFNPGSPPRLTGLWGQPRPDLPDQAALLEAALSTGPKVGKQVWVLSSDLWTQSMSLPAVRTTGLEDAELATALNFEAEGMSGQAAFESAVGFTSQSANTGERGFWIVQARTSDLELMEETVRRAGAALAGIAHPAGVPFALGSHGAGSWQRLEMWADAVVCVFGEQQGKPEVHVINSAPQLNQWQNEWEQRRGEQAGGSHQEVLVDVGVTSAGTKTREVVVRLEDEPALRAWLTAWAAALTRKSVRVPVVRPPRRPMAAGRRAALAVALAVVAVALCVAHNTWFNNTMLDYQKDAQAAAEPTKRMAELQKRAKELEGERTKLVAQLDKHGLQLDNFQLQRQRMISLMTCLSQYRLDDLMIEKVDSHGGEPRVHGICWDPELADKYASKLSEILPAHGWKVDAPKKKTQELIAGGGPCTFEIQLHAVGGPPPEILPGTVKAVPKIGTP
ncbi:MAG TPA: hypothetical protein VE988_04325 [Gemmataceae bacterium]|nr:hypothetical protein [Gemmataceae bacterium]